MGKNFESQYLTTIYLKYGSWAQPLKVIAFSDLTAKTLYIAGGPLTYTQIASDVSTLLGIKGVDVKNIKNAIKHLHTSKKVVRDRGKWKLTNGASKEVEGEITTSSTLIKKILKKHFTKKVPLKLLSVWFRRASADFFGYYSESWMNTMCRGIKRKRYKSKDIYQLLEPSIKKHNLEHARQDLIDGFISFISSDDASEQSFIMSNIHAIFAAQLVAADVGVDPIGLKEIRNSTFLLDTNVLFALALKGSSVSSLLDELGGTLSKLNCKTGYLHITREEYTRALDSKKQEVMSLLSSFEDKKIVEDVYDDFIITAKSMGCMATDDYEKFFKTISKIPKKFKSGLPVEIIDDEIILQSVQKAEKDTKLQSKVKDYAYRYGSRWRKTPKSALAACHDTSMIHVVENERAAGNKFWTLTLDRSLHTLAAHQSDPRKFPAAISVDALIELLALNAAGPEFDSTKYAPLLTNIILNQCVPAVDNYQTTDLIWFLQVMDKASELPTEDVKKIAIEISKARAEGETIQDTKLQVKINRMVQDKIIKRDEKIEQSKELAKKAKIEAEEQKELKGQYRLKAISSRSKEIQRQALKSFIVGFIVRFALSILLSIVVFIISFLLFTWLLKTGMLIDYLFGTGSLVIFLVGFLRKPWEEYRKKVNRSEEIAAREIDEEVVR